MMKKQKIEKETKYLETRKTQKKGKEEETEDREEDGA
jgi:hypothetical protein